MMTRFLLLILLSSVQLSAQATESGSQVAWTGEMLKLVKNGNAQRGEELASTCISCHGERGEGTNSEMRDGEKIDAMPSLAGQLATYTYKQLRDFANGDRDNAMMSSIAKGLSDQDMADLAAWFGSLNRPKHPDSDANLTAAKKLVEEGDGKRILPPCFVCHGAEGQGEKMDIPMLARQKADYFESTLRAYKDGKRHNDIYSRMRLIANQLTEKEIKELSLYYQGAD